MQYIQTDKSQFHSFIAAFLGGYLVFGKYNKVNEQVSVSIIIWTTDNETTLYVHSIRKQNKPSNYLLLIKGYNCEVFIMV